MAYDWYDDTRAAPYRATIDAAAASTAGSAHPITASELANQIGTESSFNASAVNAQSGATGIAQFLPSTAMQPGYGLSSFDPTDPTVSIYKAAQYDAARGVSAYSHGGYTQADLASGTDSGGNANTGSAASGTDDASNGDDSTSGNFGQAIGQAVKTATSGSGATTGGSNATKSGSGGWLTAIEETLINWGIDVAVVLLGLVLIVFGLAMFRPVQDAGRRITKSAAVLA